MINTLRKRLDLPLVYLALLMYLGIAVFPVYWMVVAAFKTDSDLINPAVSPFWFRQPPTFDHIVYLFTQTHYAAWLANTFVIGVCVLGITLALCIPAAYALGRLRFPGAGSLGIGMFMTYLVPPILLFLPLAQVISGSVHLVNTRWALVAVYPTFTVPFCLWLLMGFFKRIPLEIEEAALVDGCSRWQAVLRVVLPLSVPGILTVAIFALTLSMQDFLYALTFVSSSDQKPVTLGVPTDLIRGDVYFWGELMAGALIAGIPVAVLFNFFLDRFVEGITGSFR